MRITSGRVESAQKVLVYGPEGIGKSTFASRFPDPLFIDTEGSTKHLDVKRLDAPESWTMLMQEVMWVQLNPGSCKTLVIDTVDWAERLCISHVCAKAQKDGIEDFGYGKGYTYLAEEFGKLLNVLSDVIGTGVNVVLTAHATIRKFEQPDETGAYDRWELKLQKKTAPLVKEWCDMVLFANYKTIVIKDENGKAKGNGGKRVLYTSHAATWDAKNRHGLADELPFDYAAISSVIPRSDTSDASAAATIEAHDSLRHAPGGDIKCEPDLLVDTAEPKHLAALRQLMLDAGVTEEDVRNAVAARGYFPATTPIGVYPLDFVEGVLIGAWDQVLGTIKDAQGVPFK